MKDRIFGIQYARAFAALGIVIYHAMRKGMLLGYNQYEFSIGKMSVPFFFIISGFIIGYIQDKKKYNVGLFLKHRLMRVIPLYYIFTVVILIVYLVHPSLVYYSHNPNITIWGSFLIYPVENASMLLNPGWTLRPEIVFYVIFAINIYFIKERVGRYLTSIITCIILSLSCIMINNMVYNSYFEYLYVFAIGLIIYLLSSECLIKIRSYSLLVVLFTICIYVISIIDRVNPISVFFMGLVFYMVLAIENKFDNKSRLGRVIYLIGNASFSIYLTHVFAIGLVTYAFKYLHLPNGVYCALCIILSIIVGLLSYRFIECPVLMFLKRLIK